VGKERAGAFFAYVSAAFLPAGLGVGYAILPIAATRALRMNSGVAELRYETIARTKARSKFLEIIP